MNMDNLKVGDILVNWGSCHYWFYRVLKVNKKSVKVKSIEPVNVGGHRVKPSGKYFDWAEEETAYLRTFDDGQTVCYVPHTRNEVLRKYDDNFNYFNAN